MKEKSKIIIIVGTTASGKSDLAIQIAKNFKGEIISADSRQVYKGMDIGSNKIKINKKKNKLYSNNIRHHLIDVVDPKEKFTVVNFKKLAIQAIKKILDENHLPIITGGTGFYIDTLIYNLNIPTIPLQPKIRKKFNKKNTKKLYQLLKKRDPNRALEIHPNNKQKIIRALEIIEITGKPIVKNSYQSSPYNPLFIGIKINRKKLKEKLEKRLEKRLKKGLLKEIENLHKNGLSWKRLESFGLEYRYTAQYLQNKITKKEMIEKIITKSYQYAKRQLTWFKKNKLIHWIDTKKQAFNLVKQFIK